MPSLRGEDLIRAFYTRSTGMDQNLAEKVREGRFLRLNYPAIQQQLRNRFQEEPPLYLGCRALLNKIADIRKEVRKELHAKGIPVQGLRIKISHPY